MRKYLFVAGLLSSLFTNAQSSNIVDGEPFDIATNDSVKNFTIAYKGGNYRQYALLDFAAKKKITPFIFDNIYNSYDNDLLHVKLNSKYGLINTKGQMVIPCIYDELNSMVVDDKRYYIGSKNGRYGVFDMQFKTVLPFEYNDIRQFNRGPKHLIEITKNGKSGLMNFQSRKMIIPCLYEKIDVLKNNTAIVKKGDFYSLYNLLGDMMFSNWYTKIDVSDEKGYAWAELNGKLGIVDLAEKVIIPFEYETLMRVQSGYSSSKLYLIAAKGGKYGILGPDGKVVLSMEYDFITNKGNDLVAVTKSNRTGLFTIAGKPLLPLEYDQIFDLDEFLVLHKNGKYGTVNRSGALILPVEYDNLCEVLLEGSTAHHLLVTKGGKKGVVNAVTGKMLLDFLYDDLIGVRRSTYSLKETLNKSIVAVQHGKFGIIDINGAVLLPFTYEDLQPLNSSIVIVGKGGKYGIIDIHNKNVVLPFDYQYVNYQDGTVIAYKGSYEKYKVNGSQLIKTDK